MTVVLPELSAAPGTGTVPCPPPAGVVDPLPLPVAGWGATQARDAVREASLVLPPLAAPARLVRAVASVVFQVGPLAVKVHPPGTDPQHLAHVHAVLGTLPIAVTNQCAPVVTTSGVVSVTPWQPSQPASSAAGWPALGEALRVLHDHPGADRLPAWAPLRRLPAQLEHVDAAAASRLTAARSAVLAELADLEWLLPPGALHGDVSPDNVLATPDGPRWIDLDFACHGRREYDLSAVVRRRACGRLSGPDYRAFCRSYGVDVAGWPGLRVLDDLCALSGLGFRLWLDRCAGRPSDWLTGELDRLRPQVPAAR